MEGREGLGRGKREKGNGEGGEKGEVGENNALVVGGMLSSSFLFQFPFSSNVYR